MPTPKSPPSPPPSARMPMPMLVARLPPAFAPPCTACSSCLPRASGPRRRARAAPSVVPVPSPRTSTRPELLPQAPLPPHRPRAAPPAHRPRTLTCTLCAHALALLLPQPAFSFSWRTALPAPLPLATQPMLLATRLLAAPVLSPAAEAQMLVRLLVALCCGATIGLERRAASANAGVRTLTLVSLGSAIFALTAQHGLSGDPARMGAAISTGIGFLGSGAINGQIGGSRRQLVTAASIWIAAAVGFAAAAGLFRLAFAGAFATVWILRWRLVARVLRETVAEVAHWIASRWKSAVSRASVPPEHDDARDDGHVVSDDVPGSVIPDETKSKTTMSTWPSSSSTSST